MKEYQYRVGLYKLLACETRLQIIDLLSKKPMHGIELSKVTGVCPATISRHIAILREANIIYDVRHGKCIYYELENTIVPVLAEMTL